MPHNASHEVLESVIEHSPIGNILVDAEGKITLVNLEALRLFGYRREDLLGQKVELLIPESLGGKHAEYRQSYAKAPSARIMGRGRDLQGRRKDGTTFPIEVGLSPLEMPNGFFVLAAVSDISSRKELEKRALTAEHLAGIGKLSSHMAHEIRNPLSSISLNLDLLRDEIQAMSKEADPEKSREAKTLLTAVQKEIERLSELSRDYLKFSRLPKYRKEKTDLREFFSSLGYLLEAEARNSGVEIAFEKTVEISLFIDAKHMQQALLNLIKNAIEAMPEGGRIEIGVTHDPEKVVIRVRDEGTGMDEETQKKVFDPFYTTKEKGTGLGLSLVQQIVLEHEGRIWFESKPGKGTTFFIEIPKAPAGQADLQ